MFLNLYSYGLHYKEFKYIFDFLFFLNPLHVAPRHICFYFQAPKRIRHALPAFNLQQLSEVNDIHTVLVFSHLPHAELYLF